VRTAFLGQNKTKLIISLVIIETAFLVLSIPYHKLNGDEAWFAEESYFMSRNGYSTSNLFAGFVKEDVRVVVQHKLFIYMGAALFKLLHYDLWVFRLIPMLSFILLMGLLIRHEGKHLSGTTQAQMFLSIALVLSMHEPFYFAKIARPEMLVTLLGFLSYYLLRKYFELERVWLVCLAGFAAGMAMLAHLNGLIFVATGFLFLLLPMSGSSVPKRIRASALFGVFAVVAFTPYLFDVYRHCDIFALQISSPLIEAKTHFTILKPVLNLLREHERLFRKPEIIVPSALFLFCLAANWRKLLNGDVRHLTMYTSLLMIFLGIVVEDKQIKYSTYLVPFWGILIAKSITTMDKKNKVIFSTTAVLMSLLFATALYWQAASIFEKENYPPLNASIAKYIPPKSTCVAPMNFIFNEIANYRILSDYLVGYEKFGDVIDAKSLSDFCRKNRCEYVVFNRYGDSWEYVHDYSDTVKLLKNFEIVAANNSFAVLKYGDDSPKEPTNGNEPGDRMAVQRYISYMEHRAMADGKLADRR